MQSIFTVRLWGVRGSVPAPGSATRHHGGNTPCISVHTATGPHIVLDAGTGARALGDQLIRESPAPNASASALSNASAVVAPNAPASLDVELFLTHAHWDHLQGLPFFEPLYAPHARIAVHAAAPLRDAIERGVRGQLCPPNFPVGFEALPSSITFHDVPASGVAIGDVRIAPIDANHPGGATGWRLSTIDAPVAAIVYVPDNEIADSPHAHDLRDAWLDAMRGARLLIHDATYTPDELLRRRGWGHSSWEEAVRLAIEVDVERLVLFHHHPDRDDDAVERIVADARTLAASLGSRLHILAAAEGLVLHV